MIIIIILIIIVPSTVYEDSYSGGPKVKHRDPPPPHTHASLSQRSRMNHSSHDPPYQKGRAWDSSALYLVLRTTSPL
jgi:hypothetical protein